MPSSDSGGSAVATPTPREMRKVLAGAASGTSLEWFDFALYGTVSAIVFPKLFFPALDPTTGVLAAFAAFGVGLGARPLGAAFFANLGDRIGRQRTMLTAIIAMGFSSLGIGLLPGYGSWGIWAPVLLVLLRIVQGFSLGGESSAAQIMAMEYAPPGRRAFYGAIVNMGSPLGQVFVALVLVLVRGAAGEEAFLAWAWRIPFILGFAMAVLGFLMRRTLGETPAFERSRKQNTLVKRPLLTVLRTYPRDILRLTFLWAANVACSYMVTTYSVDYIQHTLGMSSQTSFTLILVTNLLGVAAVPLGGRLADRYGRKPVLYTFATISLVGALAYFPLLDTEVWPLMLAANVLTLVSQYIEFGALAAIFAEPFPTPVRYSGHASAYTLTNLIGGAPTPFVAALLLQVTGTPWSISLLLAAAYILSLIMIRFTPETRNVDFHAAGNEVASPARGRAATA
jgi:MFS family permease